MSDPQPHQQLSWTQQPQSQPGQSYAPQPNMPGQPRSSSPQPPKKPKKPNKALFGCGGCAGLIGLFVIIGIAVGAASNSIGTPSKTGSPPSAAVPAPNSAKAPAAPAKQADTVTYIVTGSDAEVTYGPTGSSLQGSVPMDKTEPLGNPQFYSISAQLQGGGSVTCKLEVNGKVISQSRATGGYNIAQCEISQDPFNGNWKDANSGGWHPRNRSGPARSRVLGDDFCRCRMP